MAQAPLRILFISGFMPPHAPMGAVRTGKLAAYWRAQGHDVRTIAVAPSGAKVDPAAHPWLYYVPYEEPGRWVTRLKALLKPTAPASATGGVTALTAAADATKIRKLGLADLYRQVVQFPDRHRVWIGQAVRLARSWADSWKPDLIYSSGPPHSGQVIAARLSARFGVPWIAEMRDLWIDDPYLDRHPLLKPFHDWFARAVSARAQGFVVVTEEAHAGLRHVFPGKPAVLSYNGYDPADFEGMDDVAPLDPGRLTIVHAGTIYLGRRDPTPLFQAIKALGADAAKIRCLFYSDSNGAVAALARQMGLEGSVEIREAVPRAEILRVEREVDILLECRWMDPKGDGVIPGKLFEYIGARRPILSLGSLTGEAAAIVRDNNLGLVSNDPDAIRAMLADALAVKAQTGRLPDRPAGDDKFRRETQFRKIDALMRDLLVSRSAAPAAILGTEQSPNGAVR